VAEAVVVVLDPDRVRAAVLIAIFLIVPAGAVVLASRSDALTAAGATLQTAQREGHRLAWQLMVLAALAAAVQIVSGRLASRMHVGRSLRNAMAVGFVALAVLSGVALLVHAGGPAVIIRHVRAAFVKDPPATNGGLDRRLLSASGDGRAAYWRVAARMAARDPLQGDGAW
jgi:hypothetical protein